MNKKNICKGITLVELQIVISIMAVVFTIFFSIDTIVDRFQVNAVGNQVYSHFALARSEAFSRGANTSICASNNGTTCNSNNWNEGWIVFTNMNSDDVINANEDIISIKQRINTEVTIISDNTSRMDFQANGRALAARNIRVCRLGATNTFINRIIVDQSGQMTKTTEFGDCL